MFSGHKLKRTLSHAYASSFKEGSIDSYPTKVLERIYELESALVGLKIAVGYLSTPDLQFKEYSYQELFTYHSENFISRLTTVEERAKLLAATVLGSDSLKVASHKGKSTFEQLIEPHKELKGAFSTISMEISEFKSLRNKIVHEASYSNLELIYTNIADDPVLNFEVSSDLRDLWQSSLVGVTQEFNSVFSKLFHRIKALLNSLQGIVQCKLKT
ncbi:TPA: hypothetical protein I7208_21930 [Vibrio vulnificus]|nr:hypothetical protein [Vibrio vulnificus]HAS6213250.1 hypothetical protein [Vibrio vulnificus]HAS6295491.1 hypothetical protein [Vibrio vulnificus]HAS6304681.1 hypothetical protein [Vibrio vulnificus]HAS6318575.1 hypothetical protein [Vibrio vulnificus]